MCDGVLGESMKEQSEEIKIAVIATELKNLTTAVGKVESKIDSMNANLVTQEQLNTVMNGVGARVTALEKTRAVQDWVKPIGTAVVTAILVYLIMFRLGGNS